MLTSATSGIMPVKLIQIALTRLVPTDANDQVERAQRTATPKTSFKTSNFVLLQGESTCKVFVMNISFHSY